METGCKDKQMCIPTYSVPCWTSVTKELTNQQTDCVYVCLINYLTEGVKQLGS